MPKSKTSYKGEYLPKSFAVFYQGPMSFIGIVPMAAVGRVNGRISIRTEIRTANFQLQ